MQHILWLLFRGGGYFNWNGSITWTQLALALENLFYNCWPLYMYCLSGVWGCLTVFHAVLSVPGSADNGNLFDWAQKAITTVGKGLVSIGISSALLLTPITAEAKEVRWDQIHVTRISYEYVNLFVKHLFDPGLTLQISSLWKSRSVHSPKDTCGSLEHCKGVFCGWWWWQQMGKSLRRFTEVSVWVFKWKRCLYINPRNALEDWRPIHQNYPTRVRLWC